MNPEDDAYTINVNPTIDNPLPSNGSARIHRTSARVGIFAPMYGQRYLHIDAATGLLRIDTLAPRL